MTCRAAIKLLVVLFLTMTSAGCGIPPAHSELYPPDEAALKQNYIITHDRYHPWQFQQLDVPDSR